MPIPSNIAQLALLDLQGRSMYRASVDGPEGLADAAYRLAADGSRFRSTRALAALVAGTTDRARMPEALARWIRGNVAYQLEGAEEVFAGPAATLAIGAGDCDDVAILWASTLLACGLDARVAIARMPPGQWSHAVGAMMLDDGSVELWELTDPRWYGYPDSIVRPVEALVGGPGGGLVAPSSRVGCACCQERRAR